VNPTRHRAPLAARLGASFVAATAAASLLLAPSDAAAERKNPLDEQPAVRHRLLLVAQRFEVTPLFESTINADFRHIIGGGLKLEYHLNDMFSIGGIGVAATSLDTKLTKRVMATLEDDVDDTTREPSRAEFEQHLNQMPFHGALYVSVTPWYGKLAAFGKAFVNFDFYFQGGFGFGLLKSSCAADICDDPMPGVSTMATPADDNPNNDPPLNSGFKPGLYLGGGIHVFVSDWMAIDLSVRDYAFSDNPSGADFNADLFVDDSDSRFLHHLFAGVGVSIMLPFQAKRTP
jgi:outer membrane beta-barrel protein